jgi:hypothetical protein
MDPFDFLSVMVPVLVAGILAYRWISIADQRARVAGEPDLIKALQERLKSLQAQNAALIQQKKAPKKTIVYDKEGPEALGAWVPDLLNGFGINPEVLFDDAMPAELSAILPFIKGYVSAQGGIPAVLGQMKVNFDQNKAATQGPGDQPWETFSRPP